MPVPILCAECTVATVEFERGWRAYQTDDEFEASFVVIFCPDCAEREFGANRRSSDGEAEA